MTEQKPKIFLAYAREDIGIAKKVYQDLKSYGLDIWFDTESLEIGKLWENDILERIEQSDYFIAVLSSNSMTKKGYIQKELKTALNVIDLLPEDTTYIIPIRIDDCVVKNRKLRKHHWIDVFPESKYENGFKKILHVVSPETFLLRSRPMELSASDVNEMVVKHGFYERYRNPGGKGFSHKYKLQEINGDKVIFDEISCLMWQQSGSSKRMIFEDGKKYIDKINEKRFAGCNDWRLPTLEEAMSLMESEKKKVLLFDPTTDSHELWIELVYDPNIDSQELWSEINIDPIFKSKRIRIWTSDQLKGVPHKKWYVYFSGTCDNCDDFVNTLWVQAVRSAQTSKE